MFTFSNTISCCTHFLCGDLVQQQQKDFEKKKYIFNFLYVLLYHLFTEIGLIKTRKWYLAPEKYRKRKIYLCKILKLIYIVIDDEGILIVFAVI